MVKMNGLSGAGDYLFKLLKKQTEQGGQEEATTTDKKWISDIVNKGGHHTVVAFDKDLKK